MQTQAKAVQATVSTLVFPNSKWTCPLTPKEGIMERGAQTDPGCFEKDPDPGRGKVVAKVDSSRKSRVLGRCNWG